MKEAAAMNPPQSFCGSPPGLIHKTIDPESGLLVKTGCVQRRAAALLPGTEPTQDCPLHSGGLVGFFKRIRTKT